MTLPDRPSSTPNRTVWVEIDETELDEVRSALEDRVDSLIVRLDRVRRLEDQSAAVSLSLSRINAVIDRLPTAAAMLRRYP